ncbi:hypothetical protein [Gemmobacter denitrificans]|uniref:Hemolysin type calcium-binding protein n=1 Tax=Gemmobacter denitrificans TaxID=3123040 RepID=A0ABU8BPB9_9RHOB
MELLLLMSMGLAALLVPFASGSSDDDDGPQEPEGPESAAIGDGFLRDEDGLVTGTDGDDSLTYQDFIASLEQGSSGDVTSSEDLIDDIRAGAGNDTIDLLSSEGEEELYWAEPGDRVFGGAGDDVLHLPNPYGLEVYGGAGRDDILVGANPSVPVSVYGGQGDDTLDGTQMENGSLYGGEGDDELSLDLPPNGGTGYVKIAHGDAGDDTLHVDLTTIFSEDGAGVPFSSHFDFHGGAGRDTLEVTVHEGLIDEGSFEELLTGDNNDIVRVSTIDFEDFVRGEDRVILNVSSVNDSFDLAEIRMEEQLRNSGEAVTVITASYTSDTLLTREVTFSLNAVGLTWDDIEIEGADPSLLAPIVRLS